MPASDRDWSKPAAMADPEGRIFRTRRRPVRARLSANARLLRLLGHRQGEGGSGRSDPAVRQGDRGGGGGRSGCASKPCACTISVGCCSMLDLGLYFQYQGIFDTDFDKYTEDAIEIFTASGLTTAFTRPRGFSRRLEGRTPPRYQVRPRAPVPQLSRVRRISVRHGGRDQEGTAAGRRRSPTCWIKCSDRCGRSRRCLSSTIFNTSC